MEEGKAHQIMRDSWFRYGNHSKKEDRWLKVDDEDGSGSSHENSTASDGSSVSLSSGDTTDDAASSNSSGSLYDLSELMVQLPVKRGLSKFYQGKSESFTSLSRVTSVEDLAKKPMRKMQSPLYKPYILPRPIISKAKAKRLDTNNKRGSFISSRPRKMESSS